MLRHFAMTQETVDNLDLISNDNAFLNTMDNIDHPFEQRTMFSRFGDANENPILVAKPIFHLWTLLSNKVGKEVDWNEFWDWVHSFFFLYYLLGEDQLNIYASPKLPQDLTMIASKSSYGTIAILISQNSNSNGGNISRCIELYLNSNEVLEHPSSGICTIYIHNNKIFKPNKIVSWFSIFFLKKQDITWLYRIYILNDVHTNPQKSWKQNGKPFPNLSIEQIKDIRNASKLHQSRISKLEQRMVTLELTNTPNVVLVQYCSNESSGYVLFALFPNT